MKSKYALIILLLNFGYFSVAQVSSCSFELANRPASLSKFQVYLSNLSFILKDGETKSFSSYHLLDLTTGDTALSSLSIDLEEVSEIAFSIGVDSSQTMKGVFEGDLDPSKGLFWTWQSGYINLKIELVSNDQLEEQSFHIGGFSGEQNTYRTLSFSVPKNKSLKGIQFDVDQFIKFVSQKKYLNVMSPGKKAVDIANHYSQFFSLIVE